MRGIPVRIKGKVERISRAGQAVGVRRGPKGKSP